MQDFCSVEVADSSNHALIEQRHFNGSFAPVELLAIAASCYREGIGTKIWGAKQFKESGR